jgi:hypothetical protein
MMARMFFIGIVIFTSKLIFGAGRGGIGLYNRNNLKIKIFEVTQFRIKMEQGSTLCIDDQLEVGTETLETIFARNITTTVDVRLLM